MVHELVTNGVFGQKEKLILHIKRKICVDLIGEM